MARRKTPGLAASLYSGMAPLARGATGQRAAAEAQLRYAPQLDALLALLAQTRVQQTQNVQGIRRGGLTAAGSIGQVSRNFQQQLADTPAPTSEAAAHLGLTKQAVAGQLAQMQAQQYSGINAGIAQARRQGQTDQGNIMQQLLSAAKQGALYNTSEYDTLASQDAKARQSAAQARATLVAGLAKAGFGPDGKPIPGIFGRIHPGRSPHAPVDGIDYNTYLHMTPQQRQAAHKAWSTANGKGRRGSSGTGGLTASQQAAYGKVTGAVDGIASDLPTLHAQMITVGNKTRHLTPAEITAALQKKYGALVATPIVLRAASEKAHGGITQETYGQIRQRYPKLRLPKAWIMDMTGTGGGHTTAFGGPGN